MSPDPRHELNLNQIATVYAGGSATVLRGCPNCQACHPLALKIPPEDPGVCWSCGELLPDRAPEVHDLNLRLTLPWITRLRVGLCEWARRVLTKLADWIEP